MATHDTGRSGPLVSLREIKPAVPITGWEDFLRDGEAFLKTATAAFMKKRAAFTPEVLYNLVAMAIEKFVMAALMKHGAMPYNHTMADLTEALETTFPGAISTIRESLLALDRYQQICDPYGISINPPREDEIPGMLELAVALRTMVYKKINEPKQ